MRIIGFLQTTLQWLPLFSIIPQSLTAAAKTNEPTIHETEFESLPIRFEYFPHSEVIIYQTEDHVIYRSTDGGSHWSKLKDVPVSKTNWLIRHSFDDSRVYVITSGSTHYRSEDRGETWHKFVVDVVPSEWQPPLQTLRFHASNPEYIIFNGMQCEGIFCSETALYTTDGFKTKARQLRSFTRGCWWAKSTLAFTTGDKDLDKTRTICIVSPQFAPFKQDQRVVISDNFFNAKTADGEIQQFEPNLDTNNPVAGVVNMAFVHGFLIAAAVSMNTDEMALYITDDTIQWHRAMFHGGHRVDQEAFTVLESTEHSIQIDVMSGKPAHPMGIIFTSNSNGTFFTRNIEHTNRNVEGHVDFEKIAGIQGIYLVNTVDNWQEVQKYSGKETDGSPKDPKKKKTEITFDDGRSFHQISAGGKRLHLHSVTDINNVGRVFSSPAPGLIMGVGNTGEYLENSFGSSSALYVSDDAGLTWNKALDGPHKYEFGDQGSILVAIHDSGKDEINEFKYSLDHGKNWKAAKLPHKIKPWILTTTQESSSLKFLIVGENSKIFYTHAIDFDGLHERKCKDSDMEDWWARVNEDGKPTCVMGQKQKFRRRKKDAECFLMEEFKEAVPETEPCECSDVDFECDYNFVYDDSKKTCILAPGARVVAGKDDCKDGAKTFMGSSGWRLIPGNACKKRKNEKDELVERKCSEAEDPKLPAPGSGKVESGKQTVFKGNYNAFRYWYLERGDSSSDDDETIIMRPVLRSNGREAGEEIFITHNHGKTWDKPAELNKAPIWDIVTNRHFKDMVYFIPADDSDVTYTSDRGQTFHSFKPPSMKGELSFHPDKKDWIIWTGMQCEGRGNTKCRQVSSLSMDRGDNWKTIARESVRCEFTGSSAYPYPQRSEKQIFCLVHAGEKPDGPLQVQRSNDLFQSTLDHLENVSNFATMAEFIVVAHKDGKKDSLRASASLDGVTFADAHFPYGFVVDHQTGYTVLDSSTHAINLFVVTSDADGREYGSILKSNSNGTSYVLSASGVNCNAFWYVDFEKMLGLEGVVLINVVANKDRPKGEKKLQSRISHNDGAEWAYLTPPARDVNGKRYACSSAKGSSHCALHIHGYTERNDYSKTFSSETAIGLMFGVGNVGQYLGHKKDADTFMTRDGGLTWVNVMKGEWVWQFGDQGSIIVLAQTGKATKIVKYSVDEGRSWTDYQFADDDVIVTDLTTLRSGSSRKFIVWGMQDGKATTTSLDFSGLANRECRVIDGDEGKSDYYLWSPSHPFTEDNCLFGHQSQYYRKKTDRTCFNSYRLQHKYNERNCSCTRSDFECDFNFELDKTGACQLIPGFKPVSKEDWCTTHPGAVEFYEPTGYRRIPLTTCVGGKQMDKQSTAHPCPGKEEDFDKIHRVSGWTIFLLVMISFALAGGVGWWVWRNWDGKFGQILLGEQATFDPNNRLLHYPILAAAGVVALVSAVPAVVQGLVKSVAALLERWGIMEQLQGGGRGYRWVPGGGSIQRFSVGLGGAARRFTTRDSFARGRGDYTIVDEDEGELLGEESDEEA